MSELPYPPKGSADLPPLPGARGGPQAPYPRPDGANDPRFRPHVPDHKYAVWALVIAAVPCLSTVAGGIMGILYLVRTPAGKAGRGLAIAAIAFSGFYIFATVAGLTIAAVTQADRDSDGSIVGAGTEAVQDLQVGDCTDELPVGESVLSIKVVPCADPHLGEVYADFDLEPGPFPGVDETIAEAEQGCFDRFEDFVGQEYETSSLDVYYLYPQKSSWRMDRAVTCLVTTEAKQGASLQGSVL